MTKMTATLALCAVAVASCAVSNSKNIPVDPGFLNAASDSLSLDGKSVVVRGWISLRHEDKNLWATWHDHEQWETSRCISLINYDSLVGQENLLDGKYVEVTGILRSDASEEGRLIRLASCRNVGIEILGVSSIKTINP